MTATRWYLICGERRVRCTSEDDAKARLQDIEMLRACRQEHRVEAESPPADHA